MIEINPNINGSTVNPLWIDGGPGNPTPTFNIDDPTMWMPMTVISGLASGFCERAAVVSGGTLTPTPLDWANADDSAKEVIVSNCAANIAKGTDPTTIANMYVTADATMSAPISGATTTYMTTMDKMITQLIGEGGYVLASGSTYSGFSALAGSAASRAEHYTSDIEAITSDGGAMGNVMANAYPAEWAKQRKWMLDELKYTSEAIVTGSTALGCCFHGVGDIALTGITTYPYTTVYESVGVTSPTVLQDIKGIGNQCNIYLSTNGYAVLDTDSPAGNAYRPYYIVIDLEDGASYTGLASIYFTVTVADDYLPGNVPDSTRGCLFNDGAAQKEDETTTVIVDGTTVVVNGATGAGSSYVVTNGATVTFSGNFINDLTVSSGCKAILDLTGQDSPYDGYAANRINVMAGGACQYVADYKATGNIKPTNYIFHDYVLDYVDRPLFGATFMYTAGGATITGNYDGIVADGTYDIVIPPYNSDDDPPGTSDIISAAIKLENAATVTASSWQTGRLWVQVDAGCCYIQDPASYITGDDDALAYEIFSGGTAIMSGGCVHYVYVHSGGLFKVEPTASTTQNTTVLNTLTMLEGATVSLPVDVYPSTDHKSIQWTPTHKLASAVEVVTFNNFGMTAIDATGTSVPVSQGWNFVRLAPVTINGKQYAHICGTSDEAVASAAALSEAAKARVGVPEGTINIEPDTLFDRTGATGLWPVRVNNAVCAVAVGGGTALFDNYGSFRVRQFYTNPDITEAEGAATGADFTRVVFHDEANN